MSTQDEDELDELFNKTINAKKIAIDTVIKTQDIAYDEEIRKAANDLLQRYRQEFKTTIKSIKEKARKEGAETAARYYGKLDDWQVLMSNFEGLNPQTKSKEER